jgi:hypothetical protein
VIKNALLTLNRVVKLTSILLGVCPCVATVCPRPSIDGRGDLALTPYGLRARIWGTAGEAGLRARRGLRERRIDGRGGIAGSGRGATFHSIDGPQLPDLPSTGEARIA